MSGALNTFSIIEVGFYSTEYKISDYIHTFMVEKCDLLFYDPHETFLETWTNILKCFNTELEFIFFIQMTSSKDISLQQKCPQMNQPRLHKHKELKKIIYKIYFHNLIIETKKKDLIRMNRPMTNWRRTSKKSGCLFVSFGRVALFFVYMIVSFQYTQSSNRIYFSMSTNFLTILQPQRNSTLIAF